MDIKKYSNEKIAEFFSSGSFEHTFPYLSENIVWNVIGENVFEGKSAVVANCKQTSKYFNSIQTDFKIDDIITKDNKVVVSGTAEFIRDGKRINFISACDVYEFNSSNELKKISSYCIPEKK